METLLQDLRFAGRQLARRPGFTVVAVLTLGVGIGAATAIFNAAEVALFRPLPFEHEDRLVRVFRVPQGGTPWISLRPETFAAVERRGRFFDAFVAQRYTTFTRTTDSGPERMVGIAVTAGWAETLGVRAHLGRTFSPEEERLGMASGVALLSYSAWQREFGGDEGVLGRGIILNGRPHAIVGVMQRGLRYPYNTDLWVPLRIEDAQVGPWAFNALARLRPGVDVQGARRELRRIGAEAAEAGEAPTLAVEGMTLTAVPFRELFVGDEGRTTLALLGAVVFLLLIVCANLANLLLARGLARQRELGVRTSVGASRARLVRQLLTESLALGALGSGLGVLLAVLGQGLAQPLLPSRLEYIEATVTMNATVLGFAVAIALASTLLFGLLPALRLSGMGPGPALLRSSGGSGSPSGRRLERALVVAELALGIVLLAGAGLLAQDLRRLGSVDPGYDPDGLLVFSQSLSLEPFTEPAVRVDLVERAAAELVGLPEVRAVGATSMFPTDGGNALAQVEVEGQDRPPGEQLLVNHRLVTPGFFEAVGISVLEGRGVAPGDRAEGLSVAVVSASAAHRFWPDRSPVGQRVRRAGDEENEWMTVVGVVADVREFYDIEPTWYLPFAQHADESSASSVTFAVRSATATPPGPAVRGRMAAVTPELPVVDMTTAGEIHARSLTRQRQTARLGAAFAAFGLLLAAMGLYGSISYGVSRRKREFGVRMALGGDQRRILWSVLKEGLAVIAVGMAVGTVGALGVARLLDHFLTEMGTFDPLSFSVALLVLGATGVMATVLPARRAARVDPMTVLREE